VPERSLPLRPQATFFFMSLSRQKSRLKFDFSLLLGYIDLPCTSVMRSAMQTFLDLFI
jgi:hypothetical protein